MGNQKEFIAQVEKLKKEFDFAAEMAVMINADRLKHIEKIEELEWKLKNVTKEFDDWIYVNDRLPDEGGRYWCYVEHLTDLGFSYFQWNCAYNENEKRFSDNTLIDVERVTYWRKLPEPPKQQKEK